MIDELDIQTYLFVSKTEFKIYLFDTNNLTNLYKKEIIYTNETDFINHDELDKFLQDNIFKIEKLANSFIKKIFLIIDNNEIMELSFGIKKKNYEKTINKKFLENILVDAKDLFRENNQNNKIMHILISRYLDKYNSNLKLDEKFIGDHLCLEIKFKFVSNKFISNVNKVLEKYQIEIASCMDGNYIKNFFIDDQIEFSEMICKIQNGYNENEVKLIPKNIKKKGFFEKFFQLFS
tara:strand:- start:1489 stop:2193 length:705 start_codon:yes stop_codon:yes gene_type:complete